MEIIKIHNLDKSYGDKQLFKELDASFEEGKTAIVFGPSGCGKTTLLRMIAGFEKPDSGEILLNGAKANSPEILMPPRKRRINMIFQNLALWPHMSVTEHLIFVLKARRVPKALHQDRIEQIMRAVGLSDSKNKYPSLLSGGEQQRLAIARALVAENPIMLLDEPLSNIHSELKIEILKLIKKLKLKFSLTLVYVTHNINEALFMGDELFVIDQGKLREQPMKRPEPRLSSSGDPVLDDPICD